GECRRAKYIHVDWGICLAHFHHGTHPENRAHHARFRNNFRGGLGCGGRGDGDARILSHRDEAARPERILGFCTLARLCSRTTTVTAPRDKNGGALEVSVHTQGWVRS